MTSNQMTVEMTIRPDLMKVLLGNKFPYAHGFEWSCVEYFKYEYGFWEPYAGDDILPGPSIRIEATDVPLW